MRPSRIAYAVLSGILGTIIILRWHGWTLWEPPGIIPESFLSLLSDLRSALELRIAMLFPEPHASLLAGLLLGSRADMPRALSENFKTTGLTHIVAISGYNITMLIVVLDTLLFWLPLRWRFYPAILFIACFTLLTGASASAVRAAVMGILGLLALQIGRIRTMRLTVLWTATLMVLWNPSQLFEDAGFQLSFLALIGILEVAPRLAPLLRNIPDCCGLRESATLTLSAQIMAAPWIAYLFGRFSIVAPITNLLAPPVVPLAMLFGTLSLIGSFVSEWVGIALAMIGWLPLQWIIIVARTFSSLPFSEVKSEEISAMWFVIYYGALMYWIFFTTHNGEASSSRTSSSIQLLPQAASAERRTHAR